MAIDNRGRIYVVDAARGDRRPLHVVGRRRGEVARDRSRRARRSSQFANPRFLVPDSESRIYVVERDNVRVQWLSAPRASAIAAFGVGDPAPFDQPEGIARERSGVLYVTNASAAAGALRAYDRRGAAARRGRRPGRGAGAS